MNRSLPATFFVYDGQKHSSNSLGIVASQIEALSYTSQTSTWADSQKPFTSRQDRFSLISERQVSTSASFQHGYADGFSTAKLFAKHNASKLGFVGQYIHDHRSATDPQYSEGFNLGLKDGEHLIDGVLVSRNGGA